MSEIEHDALIETKFRIYSVQIARKCICETPSPFA